MGFVGDAIGSIFGGNDAPDTPDPYQTASAQTQSNVDTARLQAMLNNYNQVSPWGSLNWSNEGDQWTATTALNPTLQSTLTNSQNAGLDLSQYLGSAVDQFGNTISNGGVSAPSGSTPNLQSSWNSYLNSLYNPTNLIQPSATNANSVQSALASALGRSSSLGDINSPTTAIPSLNNYLNQYSSNLYDPSGLIGSSYGNAYNLGNTNANLLNSLSNLASSDFNYNGVSAMPVADEAARKAMEDAVYGRMTSRLDPMYEQAQNTLESKLINQGITQGSEAWNTELNNFNQGKTDAYQTAMNEAIAQGGTELERMFGLDMQARQQGVTEANTLRNQPFAEGSAMSDLGSYLNDILGSNLGYQTDYNQNALQLASDLTGSQWTSRQNEAADTYDYRNQLINEALGYGNLGSTTSGVTGSNIGLQSAYQQLAQSLGTGANTAQWADRASNIGEQSTVQNQLLNILNSLYGGSQVSNPYSTNNYAATQVTPTDYSSDVWNAYNGELATYNAGVNSGNSLMGGLFGLGSAYLLS